ncbi:MAG TPA: nuclear transport factor 2 family protein, partial [Steroidobacteraceae bacterium]|nr:nuclear transport factor 2 family protein [Steroidobacteraceae bacterium]
MMHDPAESYSMGVEQSAAPLERLLARDGIHEVLARYARGVDRADAELLKSCYHADAIEEHGGTYTGNAHEYVVGAVVRIRRRGAWQ